MKFCYNRTECITFYEEYSMNPAFKQIPQHVAVIMDGNGRWAKKRFLPRIAGHRKGVETIKKVVIRANELGVKLLTVYAFSTENWGRPLEEVNFLMKLPKDFFKDFLPELIQHNIKVDLIGDESELPAETLNIVQRAMAQTAHCTGLVLNFAINYGGQQDILQAVKQIARQVEQGQIDVESIDLATIEANLMTSRYQQLAAPDLMIRTSGELRISNFLLWQSAYTELYFTDILWPDFTSADFDAAVAEYNQRQRRFGKINTTE